MFLSFVTAAMKLLWNSPRTLRRNKMNFRTAAFPRTFYFHLTVYVRPVSTERCEIPQSSIEKGQKGQDGTQLVVQIVLYIPIYTLQVIHFKCMRVFGGKT
jgi:hypothetical protein